MRATTRSIPKVSRATRADMMLELSPLVTAAKAPASWMPASVRMSRSKPNPTTVVPPKPFGRRRNALAALVDDGDGVAALLQQPGQLAAHPAAAHDDDVHDAPIGQTGAETADVSDGAPSVAIWPAERH